jgi:fluoride ion exporter CrcB/FEX
MSYLFGALGGGLGAMLRMFVSQLTPFPFGTLSANIIGSLAMGIAFITIGRIWVQKRSYF